MMPFSDLKLPRLYRGEQGLGIEYCQEINEGEQLSSHEVASGFGVLCFFGVL